MTQRGDKVKGQKPIAFDRRSRASPQDILLGNKSSPVTVSGFANNDVIWNVIGRC
jgi:hypothetical protein